MPKTHIQELIISFLLILIALAFLTQTSLVMPMNSLILLILLFIIIFLFFVSIVWKEDRGDERENLHRLKAGRVSYIIGSAVLIIGISKQAFAHEIDPWLVYTLIAMIISKIVSRTTSEHNS